MTQPGSYVPMYDGQVYLVAIMDWHTGAMLAWRVSTTMDAGFVFMHIERT